MKKNIIITVLAGINLILGLIAYTEYNEVKELRKSLDNYNTEIEKL